MTGQGKNAIDMLLAESFIELVKTRPIEKITIKEITDKAGVIRPTFYNHFQDKYELLEWIVLHELKEPILPLIENGMLKEGITFVLTAMSNEKEFYCKAAAMEGQNSFSEIFQKGIEQIITDHLNLTHSDKSQWLTDVRVIEYYSHFISYIIMSWINEGMNAPVADVVDALLLLMQESPVAVISHFV